MCVNDIFEIEITGITDDGRGVGRAEGMAVFVPYTLIGERVRVIINEIKKNYAQAKLLNVESPSPRRLKAECPYFYECGGCAFWHTDYENELDIKQRCVSDCMRRIGGIDCEVLSIIGCETDRRYRNKASFQAADGEVGFFAGHTHKLVDVKDCLLQTEQANAVAGCVRGFAGVGSKIKSVFVRSLGGRTVVEILADGEISNVNELICSLKEVDINLDGILVNGKVLFGEEALTAEIGDAKFKVSAKSFYQVNRFQTKILYDKVKEFAAFSGKETVWDLYCGTGTIGLYVASYVKKLIGIESVEEAVRNARENAKLNGVFNAEYFCGAAETVAPKLRGKPDVIILDPPRRGCDRKLIETVAKSGAESVIYVSCKPSTLARDLKIFTELGYKPTKIQPVDMFPRTHHVETISKLEKAY